MESDKRCPFRHIVVEVTQDCNNACLHCYNYWRHGRTSTSSGDDLSLEDILQLVRRVREDASIEQVALSGGEPMLRQDLPEIVSKLTDEGLGVVVITNGTMLSETQLKRFPEGTIFEVTLFSVDSTLHNHIAGGNVFDRILEGLVRVQKHKCSFALAYVLNRLNAHDTTRTIELGIALGAEAVLFNRINLNQNVMPDAEKLVPSASMLRQSLDDAENIVEKYGISIAVSVPIPPCIIDTSDYKHLHFGWCPRGGRDAYYTVGHTGLLRPCNHSSVILGDLKKQSFYDITSGQKAKEFWEPTPTECIECEHPLKDSCRGGCPAAAHECYGTCARMDPIVDLIKDNT